MKPIATESHAPQSQGATVSPDRQSPEQRNGVGPITKILWAVLVLAMAGIIAVKVFEPRKRELPVLYRAASFNLTDQNARPFRDADLRGNAYICDFVFTTCGS